MRGSTYEDLSISYLYLRTYGIIVLTLISLVLPTILYLLTSVKKEASYVQVVLAKESRVLYWKKANHNRSQHEWEVMILVRTLNRFPAGTWVYIILAVEYAAVYGIRSPVAAGRQRSAFQLSSSDAHNSMTNNQKCYNYTAFSAGYFET